MSDTQRSPAQQFFGADVRSDPRSLLALPDGPYLDQDVLDALHARLATIDAHPNANSVLADEVRMALHAAAARLLIAASDAPANDTSLREELLRAVGVSGGWNRDAMRRVTLIAQSHGIDADQLMAAVADLTRAPASPPPPRLRLREAAPPLPSPPPQTAVAPAARRIDVPSSTPPVPIGADEFPPIETGNRPVKVLVVAGAAIVGVVVLVAIVGVLILLGTPSAPPGATPPPPTPEIAQAAPPVAPAGADAPAQLFPAPPPQTPAPTPPPTPARVGDFTDVLRELDASVQALELDPDAALDRYERACRRVEVEWVTGSPDAVVAAVASQVEFVYRASDSASRGAIAVAAAIPPDARAASAPVSASLVSTQTWRGGLAARFLRERDLPTPVRDACRDAFARAFAGGSAPAETTFRAGALASLAALPARLLVPPNADERTLRDADQAWDAYLATARALQGDGESLDQRFGVQAMDQLMREAPEPFQSRAVFDALTRLTATLSWREGDATRNALLGWFGSPAISGADLHAVTAAIATKSGAPGVDFTMVLSPGATDSQRSELRERYGSVWGVLAGPTRSELLDRWMTLAREALVPPPGTPAGDIAAATTLARLNEAATLLWAGRTEGVASLISAAPLQPPAPPTPGASAPALLRSDADVLTTTWAVRYLSAGQAIPPRREILNQISQPPSPLEADIIADEAMRGSPVQVRQDARALVLRYSGEATIVNALLELSPTLPATRDNSNLLAQVCLSPLPSPRSPQWRVAVRRALVERLIELVTDEGELAFFDKAAAEIATSYLGRLGDTAADAAEPPPPEASAATLRARMRRDAESLLVTGREPFGLLELDARRAARVQVASGRIQAFAAEQVSLCELLAYMVASERADAASEAKAALADLEASRAGARHVFSQIEAGERAMLRLNLLRFGGGAS
ncbi:MAG: hypothetical protein SFY69_10735 [Planctomycetota bacterium]|nr:hypothetical protein [Planctomycetota bacterium]